MTDDALAARQLEEIGRIAVMPLAAPIGSGLGIQNPYNLLEIIDNAHVPVLEAGPLEQLLGSSITDRIAVGPQQGRKVFTLREAGGVRRAVR